LPAESSPGGTDSHVVDLQDGYECGAMELASCLAWPDISVGPGTLDGSMVSSLEQMYLNVEIFRLAKHAHRGINTSEEKWLVDQIDRVGPGGHFLGERTTVESIRNGEWYLPDVGTRSSYDHWTTGDRKDILAEIREKVAEILDAYEPLPLAKMLRRNWRKSVRKPERVRK